MIRRVLIVVLCLMASALGVGLFLVKHEVKSQETYLAELNRDILRGQEAIHVLNAEWSYLNDPVRLRVLAEKHLGMTVIKPTQIATLETLDSKLHGDAPNAPAVMVAKAPTPAVQPTTQVANAAIASVAMPLPRRDAEPRRAVVPNPTYSAPTYTAPTSYTPPAYAAVPNRTVTASPPTAATRRVIVVSSPALARAPTSTPTYGGSP